MRGAYFVVQVRSRTFRKSFKLYFVLLLKFSGPCFVIVFYLAMLYAWDSRVMDHLRYTANEVYYAQQRRVTVRLLCAAAMPAVSSTTCVTCRGAASSPQLHVFHNKVRDVAAQHVLPQDMAVNVTVNSTFSTGTMVRFSRLCLVVEGHGCTVHAGVLLCVVRLCR